jgi:GDP-L-fucose synthase
LLRAAVQEFPQVQIAFNPVKGPTVGTPDAESRMKLNPRSRVLVAGSETMVGAALTRRLQRLGYGNIVADEPDLTDGTLVDRFFSTEAPEYVFLVAGRTGGIAANQKYPAGLMLDNLLSECHVIDAARHHGAKKLLYLASSCCYPKDSAQPMRVGHLMTGPLEPTNAAYATAKLAGIMLCQSYRRQYGMNCIVGIPANPFGPGDDFSLEDSHVIPALMRKMHEAKVRGTGSVEIWGTGAARREFIFSDDLADACIHLMLNYDGADPINIGAGAGISIAELTQLIKEVVGYPGQLHYNTSRPDGMPMKVLDSSDLAALGWRPNHSLREALAATYQWYLEREPAREPAPTP